MPTENVINQTVPYNVLEGVGFMPGTGDMLTPKQKDIFSDFPAMSDGIDGNALKAEIETKKEPEEKAEPVEEKIEKTPKIDIGELVKDLSQEISKAPQEDIEPQKEEITGKKALVKYLKTKIEAGTFQNYNEFDESKQKLADYLNGLTTEDLEGLVDKNNEMKEESVKEQYRQEFYANLPGHLKYVARELAEGNLPPQDVYAALLRVEQARSLDPKDDNDQVLIAQSYLSATNFGTQDEINAQVEEWKEADTLAKKAGQFKPKLDNMQEQQVAAYARQAEEYKQQQQNASMWYAHNVETALSDGELNGIKLNRKQQKQIYDSMLLDVRPSVRDGRPINGLLQALEQMQIVEPDFKRLAELTWHATDPQGYKETLIQQGRNEQQSKVTKELKNLQSSGVQVGEQQEPVKRRAGIVKQKVNPFDR